MSRLGLGLGLTKGGLIPFNPLSLDPYLFFDSRSSMIGTLENPTLDLDPANPSTLDVITATRAGVATYTDADGLIQSASADTVRVDYTQGAELTPTKFQRVGYTDFSSGWAASNTTVIAGDGFGGHASQKITAGSSGNKLFTGDVSGVISGTAYTVSFYVKRLTGSGRVDLIHNNITGSPIAESLTITSEFTRVTAQFNGATSGTTATNIQFRLFTAGDQIEISQPQLEEGTTASSFVANTTGSPKFITGATYGPRVPMILVEPAATNLLTYSEDFDSSWNTASDSVTVDYGYLSPKGDLTASKVTKQTTNGHLYGGSGTTGAKSIFIKGAAGETVSTLDRNSDPNTLITLTGEWQRVELNGINSLFYAVDFRAGTATEVYLWGAQLETGSVATSYIPTSGSTAQRAKDDLQIERDSTNLVPYSEDFSQWSTKSGATLTANYGISPDGTQNSTRLQFSGSSNQLADNITTSSSSTGSVWVKGTSGETIRFGVYASEANFTLNGSWQRIQKQGTATSNILTINTYGGATARDLEIWGGQLEDGSEATSYLPTSGAAASRTTFSSFFNSGGDGTFFVTAQIKNPETNYSVIRGGSNFQLYVYSNNASRTHYTYDGGTGAPYGSVLENQLTNFAISYNASTYTISKDGSNELSESASGNLSNATKLEIGSGYSTNFNGHIKRVLFWPYHSDNL